MPATPVYDTLAMLWSTFAPKALHPAVDSPLLTWQPGQTPFSTLPSLVVTIAVYLATIFGGQALMTRFKVAPFKLQDPFLLHNFLLSVGSGLLLACMLEEIVPIWYHNGFFHAICAESAWTPRMETLYVFNYMFKVSFRVHPERVDASDELFFPASPSPLIVLGARRHDLPRPQAEALDPPSHLPSFCYCRSLLLSATWQDIYQLGGHHYQSARSRHHVLVLFPYHAQDQVPMEAGSHLDADHAVHHRPRHCLLWRLPLLCWCTPPAFASLWHLCWK